MYLSPYYLIEDQASVDLRVSDLQMSWNSLTWTDRVPGE